MSLNYDLRNLNYEAGGILIFSLILWFVEMDDRCLDLGRVDVPFFV